MNTFGIYFKRNKKAFTIIELIVVIAVIGILVLLAAPKFLNYTKKAQLVRIQNDTKAASTVVDAELTVSDSLAKWGESVDIDLETLKNEKKVYTIEGLLTEDKNIESGPYWKIDKSDFRSKLPGEFYANSGGMVYYVDTKSGSVKDNGGNQNGGNDGGGTTPTPEPTEAPTPTIAPGETNNTESTVKGPNEEEVPPGYTLLTDADFVFSQDEYAANSYSISSVNGGRATKGHFHYNGAADKVVIPHVIMGNKIKDYYRMFYYNGKSSVKVGPGNNGTAVIAVASNNPNVTNVRQMFYYSQATSLDLINFDTSKVTNMTEMFWYSQATSLDLSSFNTSNVTTMHSMFSNSQATSLDLISFDTSNVTDMGFMFSNSQATSIVGLDKFNTSNVTHMRGMFQNSKANPIVGLDKFNTAKVTNMDSMFANSQAKSLDLSSFNTAKVTDMDYMFEDSKATSLDLSSFDTSNVTMIRMYSMFSGSQATSGFARTQNDANKFNATSNKPEGLTFILKPGPTIAPGETNGEEVPPGYTLLTDADFEFIEYQYAANSYSINEGPATKGYFHYKGKADKVVIPHVIMGNDIKDYFQMFYYNGHPSYKVGAVAGDNGTAVIAVASNNPKVTNVRQMFDYSQATSLDLSNFDTSNVTDMHRMFRGSQATSLDLSSFDTSNVTNMSYMFEDSKAISLDLINFDTSNVTYMSGMFSSSKATSLDLSSFDTSNVTYMYGMFSSSKATSIVGLDKFNTAKVTDMGYMFSRSQAKSLDLSSFDTSKVRNMSYMFEYSQATEGFARTQADADKFNASSDKPAGLTFKVKQ